MSPPRRLPLFCLAAACGLPSARPIAAQAHFPVSVEATLGARTGQGGPYVNRAGAAADLLVASRLRDTPAGALLGAVSLAVQGALVTTSECSILPDGECAESFPVLFAGGALVGVQRGSARTASARVMAGPLFARGEEGRGVLGLQGRVDVSTPPWQHIAVVASLRQWVIPGFRGDALGSTSFGVGFRIQ